MAYEFKKLSDVAAVETPADTANVLIEEGGVIKKVAKKSVGETSDAIIGKIAAVEAAEEPSETANMLVEDGGALKRVPVGSVVGSVVGTPDLVISVANKCGSNILEADDIIIKIGSLEAVRTILNEQSRAPVVIVEHHGNRQGYMIWHSQYYAEAAEYAGTLLLHFIANDEIGLSPNVYAHVLRFYPDNTFECDAVKKFTFDS